MAKKNINDIAINATTLSGVKNGDLTASIIAPKAAYDDIDKLMNGIFVYDFGMKSYTPNHEEIVKNVPFNEGAFVLIAVGGGNRGCQILIRTFLSNKNREFYYRGKSGNYDNPTWDPFTRLISYNDIESKIKELLNINDITNIARTMEYTDDLNNAIPQTSTRQALFYTIHSTTKNSPFPGFYGSLMVIAWNLTNITQIAYPYAETRKVWRRAIDNGEWNNWVEIG